MKIGLIDANDGYVKKSDVVAALWELRKKYRRSEEKCAVGGCILKIREIPTVDAVQAVLCKNCKHCKSTLSIDFHRHRINTIRLCTRFRTVGGSRTVKGDDFCSYGERRTDG